MHQLLSHTIVRIIIPPSTTTGSTGSSSTVVVVVVSTVGPRRAVHTVQHHLFTVSDKMQQ